MPEPAPTCAAYAEITAPDFLPISCDQPAGHDGFHSCAVTVTSDESDTPNQIMWST